MDTVTQMLFGAVVAQAAFRRRLGRKAVVAGALVGLVPDLDVAAGWIGGPFANWVHHRGVTHSILFAPLVGLLMAFALSLWRRRRPAEARGDPEHQRAWIWLVMLVLVTHPVIDLFTSYGTQLLAPLSAHRFAIDAMPIIDPVYSAPLLVALVVGLAVRRHPGWATTTAGAALFFVAGYTLLGWSINERVEVAARQQVADAAVEVNAYPTLFQPYLRRVVAETPDEVRVGFYSVLDPAPIDWTIFRRDAGPQVVAATEEARIFAWFAMDRVIWRRQPLGDGREEVLALDHRYGMFGGTELGFWGIRAVIGSDGQLLEGPAAFRQRPEADGDRLALFWRKVFGA